MTMKKVIFFAVNVIDGLWYEFIPFKGGLIAVKFDFYRPTVICDLISTSTGFSVSFKNPTFVVCDLISPQAYANDFISSKNGFMSFTSKTFDYMTIKTKRLGDSRDRKSTRLNSSH